MKTKKKIFKCFCNEIERRVYNQKGKKMNFLKEQKNPVVTKHHHLKSNKQEMIKMIKEKNKIFQN